MAGKKSLSSIAARNKVLINERLKQTQKLNEELGNVSNVEDLSDNLKREVIYVKDEMLLDDPENKEFYGENYVENLAKVIQEKGFQGVILAYPFEGKYRIEAGHRRREAGRLAGMTEFPVLVTKTPEFDWERTQRLLMANQQNREEKPMSKAREAEGFFRAIKEEIKYKRQNGLLDANENIQINDLVAISMGMDKKTVELYRRLVKLIPELQELVDSKEYAMSALATASNLDAEKQKELYELIIQKTNKSGAESVRRDWIMDTVSRLKAEAGYEEISMEQVETQESKKTKRKNCLRVVTKCTKELKVVLENDSVVKKKEIDILLNTLEELRTSIDNKMQELNEMKNKPRKKK